MKYFFHHRGISYKSSSCHDTFLSNMLWCRNAFYIIKENKCSFYYIERKGRLKVSPGSHSHIVTIHSLTTGGAMSNLLLMLQPCLSWLLSSGPHQTKLTADSCGCWRRRAPALKVWRTVATSTCGWIHLTCSAAGDRQGASGSRWIPHLKHFLISVPSHLICDKPEEVVFIISAFIPFRHHAKG